MAEQVKLDYTERMRLIALTKCASTDEARPVLGMVRFEGDDGTAVATDSYVLGILPTTYRGESHNVEARALAKALKGRKSADCVLTFNGDGLEVQTGDAVAALPYADDFGFPLWRVLIPEGAGGPWTELPGFNAENVARVAAIGQKPDSNVPVGVLPRPQVERPESKPIRVETLDGDLLGLVMPVRR